MVAEPSPAGSRLLLLLCVHACVCDVHITNREENKETGKFSNADPPSPSPASLSLSDTQERTRRMDALEREEGAADAQAQLLAMRIDAENDPEYLAERRALESELQLLAQATQQRDGAAAALKERTEVTLREKEAESARVRKDLQTVLFERQRQEDALEELHKQLLAAETHGEQTVAEHENKVEAALKENIAVRKQKFETIKSFRECKRLIDVAKDDIARHTGRGYGVWGYEGWLSDWLTGNVARGVWRVREWVQV